MDHNDNTPLPLPTFSGNHMPLNVSIFDDDEIGEETTRRVGGFTPMGQTAFDFTVAPSLAPPSFGPSIGSTVATASVKAATAAHVTIGWDLQEAPVLPEFHPLERTAVFCPQSSARSIAARISSVLKERSIQAEYDDAEAECLTMDNVEFSVFLYRGKKQYNHGVIVEVQRLSGNSINFHNDTMAILDAAENMLSQQPPKKKAKTTPLVKDEDDFEVSTASLDFSYKMLKAGPDSQLLALQMLATMTDTSKMGTKAATATSRSLMAPGNEVAAKVVQMINEPTLTVQAMIVLSNVASVADLPLEVLKPLLITKLRSSDVQIAYLATKCLKEQDVDSELANALYKAKQLGQDKHNGLYTRASTLLEIGGI